MAAELQFGVAMFPADYAVDPVTLGRMAEERGFESLWFPEHTHIPADRATPYPAGGDLPREYTRTYDPFVALTAAATATERIRLGFGICLVVQHDPIITAKAVASLDLLSGGRVIFGVGAGWNREEMRDHGTDPRVRMRVLQERVEAMKRLWTEDEASYDGEFVSFERAWSWPKPVQQPHPPVLVGGNGDGVIDRAEAFGDVWFPNFARGNVVERIPEARERGIPVWVMGVPADVHALEQLAEAGVERVARWIPSANRSRIEAALEGFEAVVAELHGE
jgi:probable F420-dependent oxidoreductase